MKKLKIDPENSLLISGSKSENEYDELIADLFKMNKRKKPVWLLFNSIGGSSPGARKFYDNLTISPNPVYGVIIGDCFSASSVVLQGCTKRYATKNSRFHVHNPFWLLKINVEHNSTINDFEKEIIETVKTVKEAKEANEKIFQKRTGLEINQLRKILDENKIIPLEEAVKLGFVDEIIEI